MARAAVAVGPWHRQNTRPCGLALTALLVHSLALSRSRPAGNLCSVALAAPRRRPVSPPQHCYVHIPFCLQRCFYCDFPVRVVGKNVNANQRQSELYTQVLTDEIKAICLHGASEGLWLHSQKQELETLYFGGGTPSLMPPEHIRAIIDELAETGFPLSPSAEVTLEMDPGTFDAAKLQDYLACGVSRVNLGVQSFNSSILKAAGRAHNSDDVEEALAALQGAGMGNVGMDLISGLPKLTLDEWQRTLLQATQLKNEGLINHISVYDLTLEPGSPFGQRGLESGVAPLPDEADAAEMLSLASEVLQQNGFEHYEVSNFAVPGHRSRHNMAYWARKDFLGFGMGATSCLIGRRFARPRALDDYKLWVALLPEASLARVLQDEEEEELSPSEQCLDELFERVMLALRTSDGLDMDAVEGDFGELARETIEQSLSKSQHLTRKTGHRLRLTAPKGFMMSNDVISTIFADLEDQRGRLLTSWPEHQAKES